MSQPFFEDPELAAAAVAFIKRAEALGCASAAVVALTDDEAFARMGGDLCDYNFGGWVAQLAQVRSDILAERAAEGDEQQAEAVH